MGGKEPKHPLRTCLEHNSAWQNWVTTRCAKKGCNAKGTGLRFLRCRTSGKFYCDNCHYETCAACHEVSEQCYLDQCEKCRKFFCFTCNELPEFVWFGPKACKNCASKYKSSEDTDKIRHALFSQFLVLWVLILSLRFGLAFSLIGGFFGALFCFWLYERCSPSLGYVFAELRNSWRRLNSKE